MTDTPDTGTLAKADERLIVALDVPNALEGMALAERIGDACDFYKIGLGMLAGGGLGLACELKDQLGKRIFLDLKLFDIGATIEAAVRGLAPFGMDFLTVHGDPKVVAAAREGVGGGVTKILAVTILTSLEQEDLGAMLIRPGTLSEIVVERAQRALRAGADGVICSPGEAAPIRALPEARGKLIVTPGVRPFGSAMGDQKRVATPAQAVADGADHIVVGRPVRLSDDPRGMALQIARELASPQAQRPNR
ncbi:orotidine-5'-phosphate decarboxylase [Frigidibacter sp. ROC022]|uniref:orotidine-5'-phosphate decarboxylase n=1 Tax=Frigidibacter sp. ROC022 TaxID=2971796 RepID=UPI00215A241A|nr:orotidine-5'-phosphate decarboxylase [Frigidibacter sp. ROC022]MCR8724240.1 orotidine-5'-phosphate decarboxylase [Frigidibacter sp. ROC022]